MRVDEALSNLDQFLDQSLRHNNTIVRIIHGHGTGALRQAVREALVASPYVTKYQPGQIADGGDGVTIVLLVDK